MLWTFLKSVSFIPLMTTEEKTFECFFFFVFFYKFSVSVALATNQIQMFGQNWYLGGGLLKEHLCNYFVKISAVR